MNRHARSRITSKAPLTSRRAGRAVRCGINSEAAGIVSPAEAARAAMERANQMLRADRVRRRNPVKAALVPTPGRAEPLRGLSALALHPLAGKVRYLAPEAQAQEMAAAGPRVRSRLRT